MELKFEDEIQCIDYLIEIFDENFINKHTRKELAYILRILESHVVKRSPYAFSNMCKKRMCKHIAFYLDIHTDYRMYIKNLLKK